MDQPAPERQRRLYGLLDGELPRADHREERPSGEDGPPVAKPGERLVRSLPIGRSRGMGKSPPSPGHTPTHQLRLHQEHVPARAGEQRVQVAPGDRSASALLARALLLPDEEERGARPGTPSAAPRSRAATGG